MKRKEGWELRLEALFARSRTEPFDWQRHNCVTFARAAVAAQCGVLDLPVDAAADDARAAVQTLAEFGGLEAAATAVLGIPASGWTQCSRGAVALVEQDGRPLLAVCTGRTLCAPGPRGLDHLPLSAALKVWPMG